MDINKIDYDRELTFMEVIKNIKDNEKWECIELNTVIKSIEKKYGLISFNYSSSLNNELVIHEGFKFRLKKDKKVPFKEAIQAYGKEIYCVFYDGMDRIKTSYKLSDKYHQFDGDTQYSICPKQILHGEWYIKED